MDPVRREPDRQPVLARQPDFGAARAVVALPPQSTRVAQVVRERGRCHPQDLGLDRTAGESSGTERRDRHRRRAGGLRDAAAQLRRRPGGRAGGRLGLDAERSQRQYLVADHARRRRRGEQLSGRSQFRNLAVADHFEDRGRRTAAAAVHRDQRAGSQPAGGPRTVEGGRTARPDGRPSRREIPPCGAGVQPELADGQHGAVLRAGPQVALRAGLVPTPSVLPAAPA
ncbi:hypothetical protein VARIO8X_90293 [Burkholderiales bacterium 8X]|nr:hypothetical protein VARIO8X_90293 [Burkholderiales bacterium 8X]